MTKGKLPILTAREIIRVLEKVGFKNTRRSKGGHFRYIHPDGRKTNALRALLKSEIDRGHEFLRLANALSALYPRESEEKRLLDAMLLAVPR